MRLSSPDPKKQNMPCIPPKAFSLHFGVTADFVIIANFLMLSAK